jgi:hypothetical protein
MHSISGARLHPLAFLGSDKSQEQLMTHSTIKMTLQFERKYLTQGWRAPCHVSFGFFFESHFPYGFFFKIERVLLKTFKRRTRGCLGTTQEDFKITHRSAGVPSNLGMLQVFLRTFGL